MNRERGRERYEGGEAIPRIDAKSKKEGEVRWSQNLPLIEIKVLLLLLEFHKIFL